MAERAKDRQRGPYATILVSRLRSQKVYGVSFTLDVAASLLFGLIEFVEVWIVFHNVRSLGGLTFAQVCLLFGLSHCAYSVSQVLVGHVDSLPTFLREGTLEAFYLRPLSILGQLMTSEIALRRLGWVVVGVTALGYGLAVNPIAWSPTTVLLLVLCLASSVIIFCGIFVAAAACQFFLIEGAELTNAFTYGGRYAAQQPTSIFPPYLIGLFVVAVPVAFTGYLPALALLGLDAPEQIPWLLPQLAWASPLVAAGVWLVVAWLWNRGTKHYQGGGG
ncbi:ABC transporter permease [Austwickia chelonae]|uniref:ABC transporter permease n=1 Tax=Austwickia chelonae TaxID=100225 RepID=UPI000E22D4DF|nr:ABC-2 family transporter protein [Austwickia chelonae]